MTALQKYQRLESSGLWRETPGAQLREVIVGLRAATLILSDPKNEMPLAQWSLPALCRLNPARLPALYAPAEEDAETLEIDDPEMIAALDTLRVTLDRRRAKPGRLRNTIFLGTALACAAVALFWLPGRFIDYTAAMLPQPTRQALGEMALRDLARVTGSPCTGSAGEAALAAMAERIAPDDPPRIRVLQGGLSRPTALPGGYVLLPAALLDKTDGPDALAGFVLAEKRRAFGRDPTKFLLRYAGLWATLRLMTSGEMAATSLAGYGEVVSQTDPKPLDDETLLSAFKTAGISSAAYGYALDASGQSSLGLIEADPLPRGSHPAVLDDAAWLGLQAICS